MKPTLLFLALSIVGAAAPDTNLLKEIKQRPAMQLTAFEQLALKNNPTLQQAGSLVKQTTGLGKQASLLPNPMVGYQGEQIRGGAYHGGEEGAFIQQNFVLGGKLGLRKSIYEQQRREQAIGVEEQRQRVLSDIDRQFYMTLAAQEAVNLREHLLKIALDAVETAHQLANVGQADAPDVLQSEVEAEQAKLEHATAERMYVQQFAVLASTTGQPDLPPAPVAGNIEEYPVLDVDHVVDEILQDSPTLKKAQQDVARTQAQVKSAARENIPDLQIRAGIQNNFEPITESGNRTVGAQAFVTAGITLPLFNRNQGNRVAAEAEVEHARAEVTRTRLYLMQSAEPAIQGYLSAKAQADQYKNEIIPRATKAYQLYLAKYQQMGAAYPQVLVSQRTLFQLQISYIDVLQELWTSAVSLQRFMLSGGLDTPASIRSGAATINLPSSSGLASE